MTKLLRKNKKILSALFTSVYVFAVLFSGFFHTHTSNFHSESFAFSKAPNSIKVINFGGADDCFTSHFYNSSVGFLNHDFDFSFQPTEFSEQKEFIYSYLYSVRKIEFSSLRAPPSFI